MQGQEMRQVWRHVVTFYLPFDTKSEGGLGSGRDGGDSRESSEGQAGAGVTGEADDICRKAVDSFK